MHLIFLCAFFVRFYVTKYKIFVCVYPLIYEYSTRELIIVPSPKILVKLFIK